MLLVKHSLVLPQQIHIKICEIQIKKNITITLNVTFISRKLKLLVCHPFFLTIFFSFSEQANIWIFPLRRKMIWSWLFQIFIDNGEFSRQTENIQDTKREYLEKSFYSPHCWRDYIKRIVQLVFFIFWAIHWIVLVQHIHSWVVLEK